jgi:hypothetical protein
MLRRVCSLLLLCLGLCVHVCADASAPDGAAVLAKLRAYDSIYESGFTVSGTRKSQAHLILGELLTEVDYDFRLTLEGSKCGYLIERTAYQKPQFQEPVRTNGPRKDSDGAIFLSVLSKQWGYWGDDVSGQQSTRTAIRLSPDDQVEEVGTIYDVRLFGPRDAGPNVPKYATLWSLGRFYSKNIDTVTSVQQEEGSRLKVSAEGRKGGGQRGRWELVIDPDAAWMVREAKFYSADNPDRVSCQMTNTGTVWCGMYCVPEKAAFNYGGEVTDECRAKGEVEDLTFAPVVDGFDDSFYQTAKRAVTEDRPPNLTIQDFRRDPPLIFQPDELSKLVWNDGMSLDEKLAHAENVVTTTSPEGVVIETVRTPPASSAPSASDGKFLLSRKWAVVVLLVALLIGVAAWCILRSRKRGRS